MKPFFKFSSKLRHKFKNTPNGLLLLDFDGTLTPIVRNPSQVKLSASLRRQLKDLSQRPEWQVAIVSGRPLSFIRQKVGLVNVIYVGNHGYEMKWPRRPLKIHPRAKKSMAHIQLLRKKIQYVLQPLPGVFIENKTWTITLHTRRMKSNHEKLAQKKFMALVRPSLKKKKVKVTQGKKVLELRPPGDWNKGTAVKTILSVQKKKCLPIYVGDDVTDEDAFKVLKNKGLGIHVGSGPSQAPYQIPGVSHMKKFLSLIQTLNK